MDSAYFEQPPAAHTTVFEIWYRVSDEAWMTESYGPDSSEEDVNTRAEELARHFKTVQKITLGVTHVTEL